MEAHDIISSGLLEMYAAGLTSAEETLLVQEYVIKYPEVAEELSAIESSLESYACEYSLQPDPALKEKIFDKINMQASETENAKVIPLGNNTIPAKVIPISSFWKNAAAASVILLLGSIALNVMLYNKNSSAISELQKTQSTLAGLQDKAKEMEDDMHVVQSKYSMPVALNGMEAAPDAAAKIFWMKNTGDVYVDPSNLPDAPEGKQYQLWAIVDGKPVDAGMIVTAKNGDKYHIQKMKSFGKADAFAITLESEVGNTSPKGPMYVMGKM